MLVCHALLFQVELAVTTGKAYADDNLSSLQCFQVILGDAELGHLLSVAGHLPGVVLGVDGEELLVDILGRPGESHVGSVGKRGALECQIHSRKVRGLDEFTALGWGSHGVARKGEASGDEECDLHDGGGCGCVEFLNWFY